MEPGKGLIGGNEAKGERIWPSDWPCKCGHIAEEHDFDRVTFKNRACLVPSRIPSGKYIDGCVSYRPVDNLTYVEMKAKEILK